MNDSDNTRDGREDLGILWYDKVPVLPVKQYSVI